MILVFTLSSSIKAGDWATEQALAGIANVLGPIIAFTAAGYFYNYLQDSYTPEEENYENYGSMDPASTIITID